MSGKLTAEQVRESIERNFSKVAVLDDGKPVEWRDDWVCKVGIDYKSITDELNAALGGECEMVTSGTPCEGNTDKACTACGAYNIGEFYDEQSHRSAPKFCPNCGRTVKGGL